MRIVEEGYRLFGRINIFDLLIIISIFIGICTYSWRVYARKPIDIAKREKEKAVEILKLEYEEKLKLKDAEIKLLKNRIKVNESKEEGLYKWEESLSDLYEELEDEKWKLKKKEEAMIKEEEELIKEWLYRTYWN